MLKSDRSETTSPTDLDEVLSCITLYNAGAGSGKTYTITQEIAAGIKSQRIAPEKIYATTFTTKAAHEIAERIQAALIEEGLDEESVAIQLASIGTVHSVCFRLIERFVFECGCSPRLDIIDSEQSKRLVAEAIEPSYELLGTEDFEDVIWRFGLHEDQSGIKFGARKYWKDHVKEVMDFAQTYHISKDQFRSFAQESLESLTLGLGGPDKDFEQRAFELLDSFVASAEKAKSSQTLQDYLDLLDELKKAQGLLQWSSWDKIAKKRTSKDAADIREVFEKYPHHPRLHADFKTYIETIFEIAEATLEHYQDHKKRHGLVDYNDMEQLCYELLEKPEVLVQLDGEIDLLVVDEFQDTSPMQLAIFLKLASVAQRTIFVGDMKQAIYGFRGTDPNLMLALQDAILEKYPLNFKSLDTSYRSATSLVEFVNASFTPAFPGLRDVALKPLGSDRRIQANETTLAVWDLKTSNIEKRQGELAGLIKKLLSSGEVFHSPNGQTKNELAARDICILVRSRDRVEEMAQVLRAQGISVLTPPRNILEEPEVVLTLAALRCASDLSDMLARAELISLADGLELGRWLGDRIRYVQELEKGALGALKIERDEWQAEHPLIASLLQIRPLVQNMSPSQALDLAIHVGDLHARVSRWDIDSGRRTQRLHHIELVRRRARQFEDNALRTFTPISHSAFLQWMEKDNGDPQYAQVPSSPDALRIMTYHACKGLEFPCVILGDLEKDTDSRTWGVTVQNPQGVFNWQRPLEGRRIRLWPWIFVQNAKPILGDVVAAAYPAEVERALRATVEEEKRLLYVGVTRARDYLILARTTKKLDAAWEWATTCDLGWEKSENGVLSVHGRGFPCHEAERLDAVVAASAPLEKLRWFTKTQGAVGGYAPPRLLRASGMERVDGASIGSEVDLGGFLDVKDVGDRRLLGLGLHHVLAFAWPDKGTVDATKVQNVLKEYGLEDKVPLALAQEVLERLNGYVITRLSAKACYPEHPFVFENADGQLARGRIDLLVDCGDEFVLIDHKTFQGTAPACREQALEFSGQLNCYRDAVEAGIGKKVGRCFVHFVLQGVMVEVRLPTLQETRIAL